MYHRRPFTTTWILSAIASLASLVFMSGTAAANPGAEPVTTIDDPLLAILVTFLVNFPLNFIMITSMLGLANRFSGDAKLAIPPERYFLRLIGFTFVLTWAGAFLDFMAFVVMNSMAGYIAALFAVGISFFVVVKCGLKHGPCVSSYVFTTVVIVNAVTWAVTYHIDVFLFTTCCFPFSMAVFFVSIFLYYSYREWYREKYVEDHTRTLKSQSANSA
jgi:hypothetical protein